MTSRLPQEVRDGWIKDIPLKRVGKPEDVAKAAIFLGSDLSEYITGQVLQVCGGLTT
jgi:3-oxoacyl-[acyl-carrier protein] reductase